MFRHKFGATAQHSKDEGRLVLAVFSFRYDAALVPDLIENVAPIVDGWLSWDDRARSDTWYHEGQIRQGLIGRARELGADWILGVDPDERYEVGAAQIVRELTKAKIRSIFGFRFRELYSPDRYRVDGTWAQKVRWNLVPLYPDQVFMDLPIHSAWFPIHAPYEWHMTDVNLYHLKMIAPANRTARRDLYTTLDVNAIQGQGYDYLTDEEGAQFEAIPPNQEYLPRYRDDYVIRQLG
jgi:hypothetical protein